MCEHEAFLCCTKLQKIKVINALTSVRHISTCLSSPNTHARLFNWVGGRGWGGFIPSNFWWGCAV